MVNTLPALQTHQPRRGRRPADPGLPRRRDRGLRPGLVAAWAVNTVQPSSPPFGSGPKIPLINDAKYPNIGDRLSAADVSWNWYAGGWDDAAAGHPGPLFQYHHQPFNYFADYAPGKPGRDHLKDETAFLSAARKGTLPAVSFVKPYGAENEHPGYASTDDSDTTWLTCSSPPRRPGGQGDAGRRDVRRVRRPVGSRGPFRAGTLTGGQPTCPVRPWHPHPDADHRRQLRQVGSRPRRTTRRRSSPLSARMAWRRLDGVVMRR